jgi:periplasmic protein TonB
MEAKKKPEADLTKKSSLFLSIGLFVSLAVVNMAFEFKFYDDGALVDLGSVADDFEDILDIPPTEQPPPPPPPPIQQPEIIEVPDEQEIEDEIEIDLDIDVTEDKVVDVIVFDEAPAEEVAEEIFTIVEQQPEPEGGMAAFLKYVGQKMVYPAQARRMGIEGKVYVQFVVDKDGTLTEVHAVKGIGAGCDEEAVRVIKEAPRWKPGKQRGQAVKVRMILPITFKLG